MFLELLLLAFFGEVVSLRLCLVCQCGDRVVDCSGRNIRGLESEDFVAMGRYDNVVLRGTEVDRRYIRCKYLGGSRYVDLTGSSVCSSKPFILECGVRPRSSHSVWLSRQ